MDDITLDEIRTANVVRPLTHWQDAPVQVPLYVANGWFGGSCDSFGFHDRPQRDMDHGRTHVCAQMHYARMGNGGHDLQSLAALQASIGGRPLGLAGLSGYHQELDLADGELRTDYAWGADRYHVRHIASWAVPQYLQWTWNQDCSEDAALSLELICATAGWDNVTRRGTDRAFDAPTLSAEPQGDSVIITSTTNCRTTRLLVAVDNGALEWDADRVRITTEPGEGGLHLLLLDEHLDPAIAADPQPWLARGADALHAEHRAAAHEFWQSSGVVLPPPGRERLLWLRSMYFLTSGVAPYPSHVQVPTGLNSNIWSHGFAQDMYYVVENLPRLGLQKLADANLQIWQDALPAVQRYTRRLADRDGAFYPWIPPFQDWDGFEADGPTNADSFEFHNSAYVAAMVWHRYLRSGDREVLTKHLGILREVARFYLSISEQPEAGATWRLRHPHIRSQDEAMKAGEFVDTPLDCIWAAVFSFRVYREACAALEVEAGTDLLAAIDPILERGYAIDACERADGSLKTTANDPRDWGRQKHPVQLNGITLLPLPDLVDAVPGVALSWRERLDLTHNAREPRSFGWTFAMFALASARMGSGEALAADLDLIGPARFTDPEWIQIYESSCTHGWQHKKSYYFTAHGLYQQALTDAVLQDWRGVIDCFAALPPSWRGETVRFQRLHTLDGLVVDGEWSAEAFSLRFTASHATRQRVRVPASRGELLLIRGAEEQMITGDEAIDLDWSAGETIELRATIASGAPA